MYFALKKIDISLILKDLARVPLWFVLFNVFYQFFVLSIIAFRWTILIFDKVKISDVWNFVRGIYIGMFYSLFFPSSGSAIDAVKWIPISAKYPNLKKRFVLSTMIIDRLMTLAAFYLIALVGVVIARHNNIVFPDYILWLIVILFVVMFNLALLIFFGKIEKIKKINFVAIDKKKLIKNFLTGIVTEVLWLVPIWLISNFLDAGISLMSVYLFVPIITTILILPISFSGFGAREYLYVYFFNQIGISQEKSIIVSTFFGSIGILSCILGGIFPLLDKKMVVKKVS